MDGEHSAIRGDLSAAELRRLAQREPNRAVAARMQAIANALEGMSRNEAARLAGVERQALREAVLRYNTEGLSGLLNQHRLRPALRSSPCALLIGCLIVVVLIATDITLALKRAIPDSAAVNYIGPVLAAVGAIIAVRRFGGRC